MTSPHLMPGGWEARNGWNFWGSYENGQWEPQTHAWIVEYVTPASTFVDVGAWIGPTALWAAPSGARVLALEPDPVACDLLAQNVAEFPNVEVIRAAVGPETGTVPLVPGNFGWGSTQSRLLGPGVPTTNVWDVGSATPVDCYTLPDLFDVFHITNCSLIKMDIEGGEADILETVCPFLADLGVPLLVSLHPDWWNIPVELDWFDGFSEMRGEWGSFDPILAIP